MQRRINEVADLGHRFQILALGLQPGDLVTEALELRRQLRQVFQDRFEVRVSLLLEQGIDRIHHLI